MLQITIPDEEFWDEAKEEFVYVKGQTLQLEHSLISISKWEAKWHKSFLSSKQPITQEETVDYIRCMTITKNVDLSVYERLSTANYKEINDYMAETMTATFFREDKSQRPSREPVTAELIYYWMISLGIPMECQKWHLNRLLTLIQVCNVKNAPPKKRSKKEILSQNAALNAARRKQFGTRG